MDIQEYKKLWNEGIELKEEKKYYEAAQIFKKLHDSDVKKDTLDIHILLGYLYKKSEQNKLALEILKEATILDSSSEIASVGLYLIFIKLDRSEDAIYELQRYLDKYPAQLYKDTLEELLGDLRDGYIKDFEEIVVKLAAKHGVSLKE